MSNKQDILTISELKAYLYSLENEQEIEKEERIALYELECEEKEKEVKEKNIAKIEKKVDKEYKEKIETRDEILDLLEECEELPKDMERLEISRYMIYRIDIKRAEKLLGKITKELGNRYNEIVEIIEDKLDMFPQFDEVEEIDFSDYKTNGDALQKAKEKFKQEYTEEERQALIQKELEIVEKSKIFNTTPIPHEILKNSDRDLQSKLPKFNNIRQKRLRILGTMESEYNKMKVPKEIECMIDDAVENIETIKDILTDQEYNRISKLLVKRRKKLYKNTSEIRNIIKVKEKKTGILNYNLQEARHGRMEILRNIITESTKIIKEHKIPGAEEQLEKLQVAYKREKQYASVIEKLEAEKGKDNENTELKTLEKQIANLKKAIENANKINEEETLKIEKARKELLILWKIEIDSAISNKNEALELPEAEKCKTEDKINSNNIEIETHEAEEIDNDYIKDERNETEEVNNNDIVEETKKAKGFIFKIKKVKNGKHACV